MPSAPAGNTIRCLRRAAQRTSRKTRHACNLQQITHSLQVSAQSLLRCRTPRSVVLQRRRSNREGSPETVVVRRAGNTSAEISKFGHPAAIQQSMPVLTRQSFDVVRRLLLQRPFLGPQKSQAFRCCNNSGEANRSNAQYRSRRQIARPRKISPVQLRGRALLRHDNTVRTPSPDQTSEGGYSDRCIDRLSGTGTHSSKRTRRVHQRQFISTQDQPSGLWIN
mmetsp:Transcript_23052/g.50717  ORF Transcript_23052/g.50717 Transcript_23052/m.50717 type:complete len:222 (-) Transcript_23052:683-1348(-)